MSVPSVPTFEQLKESARLVKAGGLSEVELIDQIAHFAAGTYDWPHEFEKFIEETLSGYFWIRCIVSHQLIHNMMQVYKEDNRSKDKQIYVASFEDERIKIGVSFDAKNRLKTIEKQVGTRIIESWISPFHPKARTIEAQVHKELAEHRKEGEIFEYSYFLAVKRIQELLA